MNIITALHDARFFRSSFKDLKTWASWEVYLKALFALPMKPGELELFRGATGLAEPPSQPARESFCIVGRRGGKSTIAAALAVYLATFRNWAEVLGRGERGWIFILAVDKLQARIIKAYVEGFLNGSPYFKKLVEKETVEEIWLRNGAVIAVKTSSFRSVRGYTLIAAILEELGFWRGDEICANPDKEVVGAVRPALATLSGSILIGASTPYARTGVLWEQVKKHYGEPGGPLIWRASSRMMNPTLDEELIQKALAEDPAAAKAEWLAEFREDIESFLPFELVENCVIPGRHELPRVGGITYQGFADPSGGGRDSFTLGIAHREQSGRIVLDCIRERRPPFSPEGVVAEFADVLKSYRLEVVESDRYAGEWPREAFSKHGIRVKPCEKTASELYLEVLPMITSGAVELLDSKRLISQLTGLERRTRSGGKDLITHYQGGHDDCANAGAGALYLAASKARSGVRLRSITGPEAPETDEEKRERLEDEAEDARIEAELDKEDEQERLAAEKEARDAHLNFDFGDEEERRKRGWTRL